jgi:hypothetical protein
MIANPRFDAGRFRTPANDAVAPAVQGNWVVVAGGQKLFRWQMVRPAMWIDVKSRERKRWISRMGGQGSAPVDRPIIRWFCNGPGKGEWTGRKKRSKIDLARIWWSGRYHEPSAFWRLVANRRRRKTFGKAERGRVE